MLSGACIVGGKIGIVEVGEGDGVGDGVGVEVIEGVGVTVGAGVTVGVGVTVALLITFTVIEKGVLAVPVQLGPV